MQPHDDAHHELSKHGDGHVAGPTTPAPIGATTPLLIGGVVIPGVPGIPGVLIGGVAGVVSRGARAIGFVAVTFVPVPRLPVASGFVLPRPASDFVGELLRGLTPATVSPGAEYRPVVDGVDVRGFADGCVAPRGDSAAPPPLPRVPALASERGAGDVPREPASRGGLDGSAERYRCVTPVPDVRDTLLRGVLVVPVPRVVLEPEPARLLKPLPERLLDP